MISSEKSKQRSFLHFLGRSGVLAGAGLTAYEARKHPGVSALYADLAEYAEVLESDVEKPSPGHVAEKPETLPGEKNYGRYLDSLALRHISEEEVLCAHRRCRNGVRNVLPPKRIWTRLAPTLRVADELRHRLGVPLTYITSAYRCPAYNRQCPGAARRSEHIQNRALDVVFSCAPEAAFAEARKMRAEGVFCGGLGLYESFIHVDTRGYEATWGV